MATDTANVARERKGERMTELSRVLANHSTPPGDGSKPRNTGGGGAATSGSKTMDRGGGTVLLVSCFLGIFVSYFVYGLLQEKM